MEHVPLESLSRAFYVANLKKKRANDDDGDEESLNGGTAGRGGGGKAKRELHQLKTLVARIGLMKGAPSVKVRCYHPKM